MSRANKNIREIVSHSRASDRAKSSTNLHPAASNGKITTLKTSQAANMATYHSAAESGIKATGAARPPHSLGRTGKAIVEGGAQGLSVGGKPPTQASPP